jgi:hypothetical protein
MDGVLFDRSQTTLVECPIRKAGSYMIPPTVTNIGQSAFAGCTGLTNINIPNSVSRLAPGSFADCNRVD